MIFKPVQRTFWYGSWLKKLFEAKYIAKDRHVLFTFLGLYDAGVFGVEQDGRVQRYASYHFQ